MGVTGGIIPLPGDVEAILGSPFDLTLVPDRPPAWRQFLAGLDNDALDRLNQALFRQAAADIETLRWAILTPDRETRQLVRRIDRWLTQTGDIRREMAARGMLSPSRGRHAEQP